MTRTCNVACGALLAGVLASPAAAQDFRPSVFASASVVNVFRSADRSFGTTFDLGGGGGFEWKRVGIEAELHRTTGLTPREAPCAVVNVTCEGAAREGVSTATMLTGNASYLFGGPHARPYVVGSVGMLWTDTVNSLTVVSGSTATLSEFHQHDRGLVLGIGGGVDVAITRTLALRPEFRTYSAVALSRVNLGLHRGTISLRYRW